MDARFEQLCLGHLPQLGLRPACKGQEVKNGIGFTFVPDSEIGEGYLWTYPINSTCSLTIYDMLKAVDRSMEITDVRLLYKNGGKSGEYKV